MVSILDTVKGPARQLHYLCINAFSALCSKHLFSCHAADAFALDATEICTATDAMTDLTTTASCTKLVGTGAQPETIVTSLLPMGTDRAEMHPAAT